VDTGSSGGSGVALQLGESKHGCGELLTLAWGIRLGEIGLQEEPGFGPAALLCGQQLSGIEAGALDGSVFSVGDDLAQRDQLGIWQTGPALDTAEELPSGDIRGITLESVLDMTADRVEIG
jgi:hypothetical protein